MGLKELKRVNKRPFGESGAGKGERGSAGKVGRVGARCRDGCDWPHSASHRVCHAVIGHTEHLRAANAVHNVAADGAHLLPLRDQHLAHIIFILHINII